MAVHGHLHSMSLSDLLQWASKNAKDGVLEVERSKICRRLVFRDGRVRACSSNDPPSRMGQFLLSRGLITQEVLTDALERQEVTGKNLGVILSEIGALGEQELLQQVAAKALENIYSLFDWDDAVFRFDEQGEDDPYFVEVDLGVEDILAEGLKRRQNLQKIRELFRSSGLVLARSGTQVPAEVAASPMAKRILESVNGERTLAEILLRAHASEYLVIKFLYMMVQRGMVQVIAEREVDPASSTLLEDVPVSPLPAIEVDAARRDAEAEEPASDEPAASGEDLSRYQGMASDIELALQLMNEREFDQALQVLNVCYRAHPGDGYLRHLMLRCEAAYLESVRRDDIVPTMVPVKRVADEDLPGINLQPSERFLLGMIDGAQDVKSILWVAPMREVDIFMALQRLRDQGLIELSARSGEADAGKDGQPRAVRWT